MTVEAYGAFYAGCIVGAVLILAVVGVICFLALSWMTDNAESEDGVKR